jgi:exopolysaccharide production protein ExoZ
MEHDHSKTTASLPGIQALRALAASAVLLAHTGGEFDGHLSLHGVMPSFIHGGAGVDLFFVISGFVMVYSSERLFQERGSVRIFLTKRVIRIVPLYWAMTSVMLLRVVLRGFAESDASPTLALASYFFIPYPRPSGPIDPLYGLGWTLNYEMMFYLIFACTLFARRAVSVAVTSFILVAMTIAHSLQLPMPRQLIFLTEPVILEFAFGMVVALIYRSGAILSPMACYALTILAFIVPAVLWWTGPPTRWELWGIPSAILVASIVLAKKPIFVPLFLVALGDASYALYLIHPAVNFIVRHAADRSLFFNPESMPWLYLAVSLCLSILAAFAVHYWFERPVSKFLKGRFGKLPKRAAAEPRLLLERHSVPKTPGPENRVRMWESL